MEKLIQRAIDKAIQLGVNIFYDEIDQDVTTVYLNGKAIDIWSNKTATLRDENGDTIKVYKNIASAITGAAK